MGTAHRRRRSRAAHRLGGRGRRRDPAHRRRRRHLDAADLGDHGDPAVGALRDGHPRLGARRERHPPDHRRRRPHLDAGRIGHRATRSTGSGRMRKDTRWSPATRAPSWSGVVPGEALGAASAPRARACALALALPATGSGAPITPAQVRTVQARAAVREAARERAVPAGQVRLAGPTPPAGGRRVLWAGRAGMRQARCGWSTRPPASAWWRDHALAPPACDRRAAVTPETLNLGSLFYATYARAHKLTGKRALKIVALHAADSMARRYQPGRGRHALSAPSTFDHFNVILDSIMKLPLLYWGVENGGAIQRGPMLAHRHAVTMARDFVREDGSTYHVVNYDAGTGAVIERTTSAGIAPESMWARGQAWAVYGFTTGLPGSPVTRSCSTRRARWRTATWATCPRTLSRMWDFRDPAIPESPRDSSAAAIAASGLVDLAVIDPDPVRRQDRMRRQPARSSAPFRRHRMSRSAATRPCCVAPRWSYWRGPARRSGPPTATTSTWRRCCACGMLAAGSPPSLRGPARVASAGDASLAVDGQTGTAWTSTGSPAHRPAGSLRHSGPSPR